MNAKRSFPNSSMLILNGEPTFDQWVTELERIMEEWDSEYGNLPYTLPLKASTGLGCWRESFEDGMSPAEAFASDQNYWEIL